MFPFTQEPSSGSYNQCLAKITSVVQQCASVHRRALLDNKAFDIIDARCNREDSTKYVYKVYSLQTNANLWPYAK